MRIVIDIDGTICETKKPGQTYDQLKVNPSAVERIKALKQAGHYIILQTARHMKTTGGDVQKVIEKIGQVTKEWLKKHGIPYDEIHFGKPYNQVLIDDRAFVFEGWEDLKPEDFQGDKVNILLFDVPDANKNLGSQLKAVFGAEARVIKVTSSANQLQAAIAFEPYVNNFQKLIIVTKNISTIPAIGNVEEENLEGLLTVTDGEGEGFVKNDEWGFVEEVSNKPISNESAGGFYFFNHGRDFLSCAKAAIKHKQTSIASCYNELIKRGQKVKALNASDTWDLGVADGMKRTIEESKK